MDKEPSTSVIRYQAREPGQNSCPPGNDTIENASPSWGSQGASTTTREITTRLHPLLTCPVTLHLLQGSHIVLKITKLKKSPILQLQHIWVITTKHKGAVRNQLLSGRSFPVNSQRQPSRNTMHIQRETLNFFRLKL